MTCKFISKKGLYKLRNCKKFLQKNKLLMTLKKSRFHLESIQPLLIFQIKQPHRNQSKVLDTIKELLSQKLINYEIIKDNLKIFVILTQKFKNQNRVNNY